MSNIDWLMLIGAVGVAAVLLVSILIMLRIVNWFWPITDELT